MERYAVICGISDYETINDPEYSDDDARSLRDALQEISWSHITLLIEQQASKNGIRDAINVLTGVARARHRTILLRRARHIRGRPISHGRG